VNGDSFLSTLTAEVDAQREEIRVDLCRRLGIAADAENPQPLLTLVAMAQVGEELLLRLANDVGFFPSGDARTRTEGMQLVQASFGTTASTDASIFLAHAVATLIGIRRSYLDDEDYEASVVLGEFCSSVRDQVLAGSFPLSPLDEVRLQQCLHVHRAFDGRSSIDPPPEVPGYPTPVNIHPTAIEMHGNKSDLSPAERIEVLRETQRSAERQFFIEAPKHAIHIAIGPDAYALIAAGMLQNNDASGWLAVLPHWYRCWSPATNRFLELATGSLGTTSEGSIYWLGAESHAR
jgi:hypothetical protein